MKKSSSLAFRCVLILAPIGLLSPRQAYPFIFIVVWSKFSDLQLDRQQRDGQVTVSSLECTNRDTAKAISNKSSDSVIEQESDVLLVTI
jgi:hypothetical protein